jgi:hypothetical protein
LKVTCSTPPDRVTVPRSEEVTPEIPVTCTVPAMTVRGGHTAAHEPVHVGLPVPSGAKR